MTELFTDYPLLRLGILLGLFALVAAAWTAAPAQAQSLLEYVGQCVPFARAASGIQIYGDAWTWWNQAAGRYARVHIPRVGSVMAFQPYGNMTLGHVDAVSDHVADRLEVPC